MSTPNQTSYITDLAVLKTKELKEVKELLISQGIVSEDTTIVQDADTLKAITDAITDKQASALIDALLAKETPVRSRAYSDKRVQRTVNALDNIKKTIQGWNFE